MPAEIVGVSFASITHASDEELVNPGRKPPYEKDTSKTVLRSSRSDSGIPQRLRKKQRCPYYDFLDQHVQLFERVTE